MMPNFVTWIDDLFFIVGIVAAALWITRRRYAPEAIWEDVLASLEIARLIEALTADEGDSVEFVCENPDPKTPNNRHAVICAGFWTLWHDLRFDGPTRVACLRMAAAARTLKYIPEGNPSA